MKLERNKDWNEKKRKEFNPGKMFNFFWEETFFQNFSGREFFLLLFLNIAANLCLSYLCCGDALSLSFYLVRYFRAVYHFELVKQKKYCNENKLKPTYAHRTIPNLLLSNPGMIFCQRQIRIIISYHSYSCHSQTDSERPINYQFSNEIVAIE